MTIEIKVPTLPESVNDATVAKWYKKEGDAIKRDENLVDLETDKVMLEVPAPHDGVIEKILVKEGTLVKAHQVIAMIREGAAGQAAAATKPAAEESKPATPAEAKPAPAPAPKAAEKIEATAEAGEEEPLSPAVRRLVAERGIDINQMKGTGKGGRLTKKDIETFLQQNTGSMPEELSMASMSTDDRSEKRVPMSRIRARIAERLLQVQREAAILTTFNEINMKPVMDLRKQYQEQFEKVHGARLGFMSFFTKAAVEALKRFPGVNASIDGNEIVYHNYCDVGIAIGTERGLVVPILRNAEAMSMADIEKKIRDYATKAQAGKLAIEDLSGGTFTITNGGTYGSLLSTPIINPPQTAILGMHKIMDRAVVEKGEIVIRPMMYVALSYDHRMIDGSEAVMFLVTIKDLLESPARMLLEV
jgi:2-oxoglutarate dehydrogenase E2 component (dihydrolipoamide succinyltransferase)